MKNRTAYKTFIDIDFSISASHSNKTLIFVSSAALISGGWILFYNRKKNCLTRMFFFCVLQTFFFRL